MNRLPTEGSMRVLAALVLASLGLWPSLATAQAVKIGAVVPLTGRYGAGGAQVRAGYDIAVEHINAAGGVSMGGCGSDLHAAAAAVAEKNKTPYLGVAFALHKVHQQGFRYLFSPFWKSPDISEALPPMLNSLPAGERPKTVAIFQEKTDWGREMAAAWTEAGKAAGYQVVLNAEYAPGAKDFSDLILRAKSANADAVFALPTPPDGMTMIKQMKELSYTPKLTFFIRAPDPPIWTKNLGKDGDYVMLAPGWHRAVKAPGVKELNDAHQAKFGRPADPVTGPGKFRPDGTGIVKAGLFAQWVNGKQELVWPKEYATVPLAYPAPPFAK